MSQEKARYIKPQSAVEALELIQKLFNQYRNAPLTQELLTYHLNLLTRLQTDIKTATEQTGDPKLLTGLQTMTAAMQSWSGIRFSGRPFPGKLRHFKLDPGTHPHFKTQVHKIKGTASHRSKRH